LQRYPRITAHLICESLGHASPTKAAMICFDGAAGRKNWCEWIDACYGGDAGRALRNAVRDRHHHRGYMADYAQARRLVEHGRRGVDDTAWLASWF
jgi:hypothetical protein